MRGVDRAHSNALERNVELLCPDLRERRQIALTELHLSGGDLDISLGIDPEPGIKATVSLEVSRQPGGRGLPENRAWAHGEEQHDPGCSLTELTAGIVAARATRI